MGKYDDNCDWCNAYMGDSAALDAHAGRHKGGDPITLKIGYADQSRSPRAHHVLCGCSECKRIRAMIAEQKKDYGERLRLLAVA